MNDYYNSNDRDFAAGGNFEPEELPVSPRRPRRRVMAETAPASPAVSFPSADQLPPREERRAPRGDEQQARPSAQPRQRRESSESRNNASTAARPKAAKPKGPSLFRRIAADGRPPIFLGVVCLVTALYLFVAFISFFATAGAADQSIIHSAGLQGAIADTESVVNAGGPFGAWTSETLISRGMGVGGVIIPIWLTLMGLGLVGLRRVSFWSLTAKALISTISISIVVGMVTYGMSTSFYWGGRHGHDINMFLRDTTGVWGMIGVSLILVTGLVMLFFHQITGICNTFSGYFARRKEHAEARRQAARMRQEAEAERRKAEEASRQDTDVRLDSSITETENAAACAADEKAFTVNHSEDAAPKPSPAPISFNATRDPMADIPEDEPDFTDTIVVRPAQVSRPPQPAPAMHAERAPETITPDPAATVAPVAVVVPAATVVEPAAHEHEHEPEAVTITEAAPIEQVDIEEAPHELYDPTAELSHYQKPSLDILIDRPVPESATDQSEQQAHIDNIKRVLSNFGIEIATITATVGPTVTLYEIVPAEGVRINKIKSLEDDIALSLAAIGIRIIAPMPGKGTIGIEVPNAKPQVVSIRSILASRKYQESKAELPMAMGATISNDVYIADLTKMPHLLVAGSTGMGKSVGLNTIIASILYKKHPAEVKFVLIDPKMVEFSLYNKIEKHFLAKLPGEEDAIITNMEKVVPTLLSLCIEMDRRYELLKSANVRAVKEYNEKFVNMRLNPAKGHRYMPYIVVVIDEFADLIMTAGKEVETPIARIAQKARAVGIHVILATQRPSANIITGVIRANFPGRIAFRVTQMLESRIILDRPGANQLIGRGDMLFSRDGIIDRVQCAFIDTPEVEAICDAIGDQVGYPQAYELPEYVPPTSDGADAGGSGVSTDRDPLFEEAARLVIEQNVGSASLIQRRFQIGYPRAGKLIDQLERAGVVGPAQGGKPRKVTMTMYDFDQWLSATGTTQYVPLNCDRAADC